MSLAHRPDLAIADHMLWKRSLPMGHRNFLEWGDDPSKPAKPAPVCCKVEMLEPRVQQKRRCAAPLQRVAGLIGTSWQRF